MASRGFQKWIFVIFEPIPTLYNFPLGLLYRWLALIVANNDQIWLCMWPNEVILMSECLICIQHWHTFPAFVGGDIINARVCFFNFGVLVRVFCVAKWTLKVSPSDRGRQFGPTLIHPFHHPNISLSQCAIYSFDLHGAKSECIYIITSIIIQ